MILHILKIEEQYFVKVDAGLKTFELRKNDRDFQVGDLIHIVNLGGNERRSKENDVYQITYVLKDVQEYGLDKDYCILGIKKLGITK